MSGSGRLVDYLGSGLAVDRPTSLTLVAGAVGIYFATDTEATSYWDGTAWTSPSGSGTVTSVDMSVPADFAVSGNPITSSGTLALSENTQAANKFKAGPASGADATPDYRSIEAADLPATAVTAGAYGDATHVGTFTVDAQGRITDAANVAITGMGTGTVTSVAMTVPSSFSVSGSPITTSGTLAISENTQAANLVKAGPSSGADAAPTYRSLVASDIPDLSSVYLTDAPSDGSTYGRKDGTWSAVVSGTGTVTSVALTAPSWLGVSGSPVTTSGTLALAAATGQTANSVLATPDGATGALSVRALVSGDIPDLSATYATAAQGALADSAVQSVVAGTNITVDVTDPQNPVVSAATGMTNPMTTAQDIIIGGSSGTPTRMGIIANGKVLGAVSGAWAAVTLPTGDMTAAVYDPAAIAQQVVGTTATQTLTNKDLSDSSNTFPAFATAIANGTATLGTSAIASGASATVVTVTATGVATTDSIDWGFNGDPTGVTGYAPSASGMLTIIAYPTAGNVNFVVCNNTGASITPGAITLNWRVLR